MNISLIHPGSSFGLAMLVGLLTACSAASPDPVPTATPPPASATPVASSSIAKISEIQKLPVFVRLLNAAREQAAREGMRLQTGETLRTQGQALTQIDLHNGLAFRLAGDAVLTLKPDNRLNLTAGEMITWIQPGKKIPTEIITPTAVAGIRGTTVFVKIPKDPQEGVLFFAWEGSVAVRLPGETEEVLLKTADEVRIRPGDRDIRQIRQRVRRMSRAEWRQKRQTDPMLRSFKIAPMSTLSIIDQIKPGQAALSSVPLPEQTKKHKADGKQAGKRTNDRTKAKPEKALKPSDKPHARKLKPSGKDDVSQKADDRKPAKSQSSKAKPSGSAKPETAKRAKPHRSNDRRSDDGDDRHSNQEPKRERASKRTTDPIRHRYA